MNKMGMVTHLLESFGSHNVTKVFYCSHSKKGRSFRTQFLHIIMIATKLILHTMGGALI